MRIVLVSEEYPPSTAFGGIGSQTEAKAYGLGTLGHDVTVLSHSSDRARHDASNDGIRVLRLPGFDAGMPICTEPARWLTWSATVAAALAELGAKKPIDLIDVPEWGGEGYIHLLNRTEWSSVPTVVHLHGPLVMLAHTIGWPEIDSELYRVGTVMEGTSVRLADAVFASGTRARDWCARHYGIDAVSTPILHTGVDTRQFAPPGSDEPKRRPTIVFVGKIAANKGVDDLVEAACHLRARVPDLRLIVAGRGEPSAVARVRARAASHPDLIDLRGFVSHDDLPGLLRSADVFAAPSRSEGGPGFVYLEAMACGLPVVACSDSGIEETVQDAETGLLVPPGDPVALMEALHRLLADPGFRRRLGAAARDFVVATAERQLCIRRIEAFYESVVRRVRGSANLEAHARRS